MYANCAIVMVEVQAAQVGGVAFYGSLSFSPPLSFSDVRAGA
jgi:hypothetical protein